MNRPVSFARTAAALLSLSSLLSLPSLAQAAEPAAAATPYPLFGAKPLPVERTSSKVVGAYVPQWEPVALVDRIPRGSLTHILYAFLRICGPGQLPKDAPKCAGKQDFELTVGPVEQTFDAAFQRLKQRDPHVKVVASVGGWGGSDPFFHFANTAQGRAVFVASVQRFLREHPGFDGIDIDWEHPGGNGAANGVQLGSPADGEGYADLMHDLRRGVDALTAETGRPYLVTTAVNTTETITKRVNFKRAAQAMDLVFMMSYDYYGGWERKLGNHSTLMSSSPTADDSLDRGVKNLTAAGVPKDKLVAGVAMYGRGFSGAKQLVSGSPSGPGFPGADGSEVYRVIAANYLGPKGQGLRGFKAVFDAQTQAWNLYHPKHQLFIGYDDPRAVIAKGRYAVQQGLAGIFAWELSQDNGDLLNAMNHGVGNLVLP